MGEQICVILERRSSSYVDLTKPDERSDEGKSGIFMWRNRAAKSHISLFPFPYNNPLYRLVNDTFLKEIDRSCAQMCHKQGQISSVRRDAGLSIANQYVAKRNEIMKRQINQ